MSERRAVYAIFDGMIHATIWVDESEQGRSYAFTVGRTDGEGDHFKDATTFHALEAKALMRVAERAVSVIQYWAEEGESIPDNPVRADCTEWAASRYRRLIQIRAWEIYNPPSTDQPEPEWSSFIDRPARKKQEKG